MGRLILAAALLAALLIPAVAQAAPTHYVTMSDGASIAINVKVPPQSAAGSPCPAFFEMSGYESGTDDGKTPLGDLYRDIVYPGGVTNYGFPLLWTGAVRPVYDYGGGTGGGLFPPADTSAQCAANQAGRSRTVLEDPLIQGLDDTDSEWYRTRSLVTHVDRIDVPVHITAAYQDEQTGPRGPTNVFDHLSPTISKRLVLTNGEHGTQTEDHVLKDRIAWMDYWLRGTNTADLDFKTGTADLPSVFGPRDTPTTTSRVILGNEGDGKAVGEIESDGFPLGQTQFTDAYVTAGNRLTFDKAAIRPGTATWVNGSRRQAYSHQAGMNTGGELTSPTGPDEVEHSMRFDQPTAIAGPITANLFVASSAPDTELFVQLIDRAPDGTLLYLNRGMLRASHRQIDRSQSQFTADGRIYRPYRPHTERALVTPGATIDYLIDVYPVGHVFPPGHELVVKLHAPPLDDNDYMYVQKTLPGVNTLHFGAGTPSRLMLPVIPMSAVRDFTPPSGQCPYVSMRCIGGR